MYAGQTVAAAYVINGIVFIIGGFILLQDEEKIKFGRFGKITVGRWIKYAHVDVVEPCELCIHF